MFPQLTVLPLTVLNLSAATGRTPVGLVADRIGPVNALLLAVYMSALTQIVIWNVISTYAGIVRVSAPPLPLLAC